MFYYCKAAKDFWTRIEQWIIKAFKAAIPLRIIDILFGIPNIDDKLILYINFIILIGKWFIYVANINKTDLFFLNFLFLLKSYLIIENYIEILHNIDLIDRSSRWTSMLDIL